MDKYVYLCDALYIFAENMNKVSFLPILLFAFLMFVDSSHGLSWWHHAKKWIGLG